MNVLGSAYVLGLFLGLITTCVDATGLAGVCFYLNRCSGDVSFN